MKKIFLVLFMFITVSTAFADACSCGSFEEGTYDYTIKDGSGDCCSGTSGGSAYYTNWIPGPGRTWVVTKITEISFSDAIKACCPIV